MDISRNTQVYHVSGVDTIFRGRNLYNIIFRQIMLNYFPTSSIFIYKANLCVDTAVTYIFPEIAFYEIDFPKIFDIRCLHLTYTWP